MKDNFSKLSQQYSLFRPTYPVEIFKYITSLLELHVVAWDCATGNGQVARELSPYFKKVIATDISVQQIKHAYQASNIHYSITPAERTSFPDNHFDAITVGQAIHWFDFSAFYKEVRRTAKNNSVIAVFGYDLPQTGESDKVIHRFYNEILKGFWDPERKFVDERYRTIPFPFTEIKTPEFESNLKWNVDHLLGYLGTWSAVQRFKDQQQRNPVDEIREEILNIWQRDQIRTVTFPIMIRIGRIEK